jgi:glycerol uptake facilitator protein
MSPIGLLAQAAPAAPTNTHLFWGEVVGTAVLITLGDGVVAGVLLHRSKAQNAGWIVITWAWAMGVLFGVYTNVAAGGVGHLNPAVTIAQWVTSTGAFSKTAYASQLGASAAWTLIAGEFIGAFIGAIIVFLSYLPHWRPTEDAGLKLAVYCTGPAIRNYGANLITEIVGTAMLLFGIFGIFAIAGLPPGFGVFAVALLVFGIGMSLGGPTGYAINPARDLGPRIMHAILPIPGKGTSDWAYSWVPVIGPIIGGILGALLAKAAFTSL